MAITSHAPKTRHGATSLVGLILLCNGVGFASAMVGNMGLYQELVQPSWAPPAWLFGPVWTSLYILMGVATWLVLRAPATPTRRAALIIFAFQLALNAAWTPVFFGLEAIGAGLVVIIAVDLAVVAMAIAYARIRPLAGMMIIPLVVWVGFATALNAAIWSLNR